MKLKIFLVMIFVKVVITAQVSITLAQTTVFDLGQVIVDTEETQQEDLTIEEKSVIKQKSLKSHKVVDVSEILADELIEASMIRKSGYGNEVGLRGFTKSNLRFLQDNTLIEGSCGSRKDPPLSHINMLTVKSMEVKEGPYDVTVPGALGGNINVITKNPQEGFHGEAFSKFGAYGFLSQGGYITGGNSTIKGLFGYNYSKSDQYKDGDGKKLSSFNEGYNSAGKRMDAFEKHDFWGKIMLKPVEDHELLISSSLGHANDIMTPRVGMDTEEERTYLNKFEYKIDNLCSISEQFKISAYYNRIEHYPYGKYRSTAANNKRIEAISYITGGQIENQTFTELALFTYGADFYYRNWYGDIIHRDTGVVLNDELFPDVDMLDFGMYLKAERDFDKLSVTVGLRGDIFHTEAQEKLKNSIALTDDNQQTDVYPSAYIFCKYFINDQTNIFGGTGLTTRTPTAVERYTQQGAGFYGNPGLDPSHNFETDLGFETKFFDRLTFRTKGFYSYINDFIYQTSVPARTWTNIDAYLIGGDINLLLDICYGFSIDGGLAYQRGRKLDQPEQNDDKDLAEIAPLKTKLALNYDNKRLNAVFEWVHSDDYDNIDKDGGETELDGWDVFNFRVGYQFADQKGKTAFLNGANLNFGINNIFDKEYAVANSYEYDPTDPDGTNVKIVNEPGRFIYGSLTYKF